MKKGFSFLEILIVLAIISIVFIFTLFSQNYFIHEADRRMESVALLHAIQFAKELAVTQAEVVQLCKSRDRKTCSGEWGDGYIVTAHDQLMFEFHHATSGFLHWRAFPLHKTNLTFLPNGRLDSENGTFWHCISSTSQPDWAVVINQAARARLVYSDEQHEIKDGEGKSLAC